MPFLLPKFKPPLSPRVGLISNHTSCLRSCFSTKRQSEPTTQTIEIPSHTLSNGRKLPAIGFGTWGADHFSSDQIAEAAGKAVEMGYTHLDCGSVYGNQKQIGHVLRDVFRNEDNPTRRQSLHITSKIWNDEHAPPKKRVYESVEKTLRDLGTDYLDLLLIHWPFRNSHIPGAEHGDRDPTAIPFSMDEYVQTWDALNEMVDANMTRSIGVSNMTIKKLNDLASHPRSIEKRLRTPAVNQVEAHPYFQQNELLEYCRKNEIVMVAAMPLGSPERPERDRSADDPVVLNDEVIQSISNKLGVSPAQVILAWHVNRGTACVPKAVDDRMIHENLVAGSLVLSEEVMTEIAGIDKNHRLTKGQVFCWKEGQDWKELWDE